MHQQSTNPSSTQHNHSNLYSTKKHNLKTTHSSHKTHPPIAHIPLQPPPPNPKLAHTHSRSPTGTKLDSQFSTTKKTKTKSKPTQESVCSPAKGSTRIEKNGEGSGILPDQSWPHTA
ncbi:hypothetical protein M758_6G130600 [Ceratodon purpureus]|nr:hypothetical protein M758_6G130600 [Ceratodon purpureus]